MKTPTWLNCGIYSDPVPNVYAVHSLEHGAIWVTYDPTKLSADALAALREHLPSTYVILSPYVGIPSPIVLSGWNVQLRVDSPDDPRPQPTLTDIPRLLDESRAAGVHIDLIDGVPEPGKVPAGLGRTAYRVVQEALTNARRHASGMPVRVELHGTAGGELDIEVRNPLSPDRAATAPGSGLIGLTERAQLAGGELTVENADGEFRLRVCLPWTV